GVASALFLALAAFTPAPLLSHTVVFALAVVIGFYVIGNVHHALHTPLMSVTNAISGIIIIGAISQIATNNTLISTLAFIAVLVASINVFGGFTLTHRMLAMFHKDPS
ncbi:NAD(P)(+) transhydrogenase (Re/Si-specific) subunit alpha, partial [Dermatophilus congolensis]